MTNSRWYSVEEASQHLGIKPTTLYKWIERKKMPAHKVGRLWKFKLEELDQWVKSGQSGLEDEDTASEEKRG